MDKGLAEQVDERLLSVNLTDAQPDYIIMTANHRSQCQPHLQMEKCFPEKVMNIIMLKNTCWPSLAPLNVVVGETGDFWWVFESVIFIHVMLRPGLICWVCHQAYTQGLDAPSWLYADDGENILCVTMTELLIMILLQETFHHTSVERNILQLEENVTNGTFWYCRLLPESGFWWSTLLIRESMVCQM